MTRTQEIRHECLLQLYGSGAIPLSIAHIHRVARREQFDYTLAEVRDQLHFLRGQKLCEEITNTGTGENLYVITSQGMIEFERRS